MSNLRDRVLTIRRKLLTAHNLRKAIMLTSIVVLAVLVLLVLFTTDDKPVIGNATGLELFWVAENAVGALYSVRNVRASNQAYRAVVDVPSPDAMEVLVARSARRLNRVILIKQASYLGIGILFAFAPQPVRTSVATIGEAMVIVVFIGGSMLLSFLGMWGDEDREDAEKITLWERRLAVRLAGERARAKFEAHEGTDTPDQG